MPLFWAILQAICVFRCYTENTSYKKCCFLDCLIKVQYRHYKQLLNAEQPSVFWHIYRPFLSDSHIHSFSYHHMFYKIQNHHCQNFVTNLTANESKCSLNHSILPSSRDFRIKIHLNVVKQWIQKVFVDLIHVYNMPFIY